MPENDTSAGDSERAIHVGDCVEIMSRLPADSIDMAMFSPPYWGQRDYGVDEQMGAEETPEQYVSALVEVCEAVGRVLKPDGSLWLNVSDKFNRKRKMMMPHRVAIALIDEGWYVRNDVVWHKTNARPESVKDRLSVRHEYLFHASPSRQYQYDLDEIREPHSDESVRRQMRGESGNNAHSHKNSTERLPAGGPETMHEARGFKGYDGMREAVRAGETDLHPMGKNPGDVWEIATDRSVSWHPAVYPVELCERPIRATCPPGGVVLDPMVGSGTTLVAAEGLGRRYIGIELNEEYAERAAERVSSDCSVHTDTNRAGGGE